MSDGTSAQGKRNTPKHVKCRRCGSKSYHATKGVCSSCGFGRSAKRRDYNWTSKAGDS